MNQIIRCMFIFLMSSGVTQAWGQNLKPTVTPYPTASPGEVRVAEKIQKERAWQKAPWTQNNKPFAKIRQELDADIRAKVPASAQAKKYALKGNSLYQPLAQFRWAYVAYAAEMARQPDQNKIIEIGQIMDLNLNPGAYDWVRLRFLVEASKIWFRADEIRPLGQRLLKHNPKDLSVCYALIDVTNLSKNVTIYQRQQNLLLARTQLKKYPQSIRWLRLTAASARSIWFNQSLKTNKNQSHKYMKEAKNYYVRVLELLPAQSPTRRNVVELIVGSELNMEGNANITIKKWRNALATTKWK